MSFNAKLIFLFFICLIIGFISVKHTDIFKALKHKNHRILVCLTSYKRPIFLSGQLLRFKNQTYKNFHISAAVKGVPEKWAQETFMDEWQPLIDSGLVSLKFRKNGTQLKNFLDTVRDIDLSKYDYFCKIDDDDWYAPDYLESVNNSLNLAKNIPLSLSMNTVLLKNGDLKNKEVSMYKNSAKLSGPTMCLSRDLILALLKVEKDPSSLKAIISRTDVLNSQYTAEDNLFCKMAENMGGIQHRQDEKPKVVFGSQYPSVMRGNYLSQ